MTLLLVSFLAGVLTVLAPCVLPLLPIIIGGAAQHKRNPYLITASLAVSIVVFTLLLKFSTVFIMVPASTWSIISGVIIIAFGVFSFFPNLWTRISLALGLQQGSDKLMESAAHTEGRWGDVLLGLSFGPVFSSCSPTYFVILATVLPQTFGLGLIYLSVYALGLSLVLLLISLLGQKFVSKVRWAANPNGWFKKSLGILFILVGIFIITGADKKLQTFLLDKGYFNINNVEYKLLDQGEGELSLDLVPNNENLPDYQELVDPSGFVNSDPFALSDLIGNKVILVDFMTYSCINCIRTFPYLNDWYSKYQDDGLEIVGIHTPEFAFEKNIDNVRAAMEKYGIEFPVVLDNDYGTWNAYGNHYWPRKYLIDLQGKIVYDHIGEGEYAETEAKIRELLGLDGEIDSLEETPQTGGGSPETYFGAARNELLFNGEPGTVGIQNLSTPANYPKNVLILDGSWDLQSEFASPAATSTRILFKYVSNQVFLVASSDPTAYITVLRDGVPLPDNLFGEDVSDAGGSAMVPIDEDRLYHLVANDDGQEHTLELRLDSTKIKLYTFTFGS